MSVRLSISFRTDHHFTALLRSTTLRIGQTMHLWDTCLLVTNNTSPMEETRQPLDWHNIKPARVAPHLQRLDRFLLEVHGGLGSQPPNR